MFDKVTLIYIAVCTIIPILYLIRFATYKTKKKKNYKRAFIIALIMFLILIALGIALVLSSLRWDNERISKLEDEIKDLKNKLNNKEDKNYDREY